MRPLLRRTLTEASVAVQRSLVLRLLALPRPVLARLAGGIAPKRSTLDGQRLDEQAQLVLALGARFSPHRPNDLGAVRARREFSRSIRILAPRLREMARIVDTSIPGARANGASAPRIPIRIFTPKSAVTSARAPAILHMHGGGFVVGDLDGYEPFCRWLADEAGCAVVSVGYRLAPENKFPAAVDDAVAAYRWLRARGDDSGIDPARIAVAGDSAGGNLAAVLCQQLRDAGEPLPIFQLLIYPATDMRCNTRSHEVFAKGFMLEGDTIRWYIEQYTRTPADIDDPRASPLRARDFRGLPPAMVVTAGFDPLRDEGDAYAEALRAAGVPVVHRCDRGMFHGYASVAEGVQVAREMLGAAVAELRRAVAPPT